MKGVIIPFEFNLQQNVFFQIDLYLRPLKYEVWIVILLSLPVVAAAIYVIKKLSPLKDKEVEQFDKILLHVYGALMSKGNPTP